MTKTEKALQQKIDELEIKVAFHEHTLDELNDALTQQQISLDKLHLHITFLVNKLKTMEPTNIASMSEETPPPHY